MYLYLLNRAKLYNLVRDLGLQECVVVQVKYIVKDGQDDN